MKHSDTRERLLAVETLLKTRRAISMQAILQELSEKGITADRKAVYGDILVLTCYYPIDYDHKTRKWIFKENKDADCYG